MSVNKVIILGRLGQDPELKQVGTSQACKLVVATSEKWTDKQGEKKESTQWHNIQCWGKLAELCSQYLAKGHQVYVEGKLETRSFEKDGQKRYVTEIKASSVQFIESKNKSESFDFDQTEPKFSDDSIPF